MDYAYLAFLPCVLILYRNVLTIYILRFFFSILCQKYCSVWVCIGAAKDMHFEYRQASLEMTVQNDDDITGETKTLTVPYKLN